MRSLILLLLICSTSVFGAENVGNCLPDPMADISDSKILITDMVFDEKTETIFCFDPEVLKSDKSMLEQFKIMDSVGLFDKNNCLIEKNRNANNEEMINRFIQKNLENNLQVFAVKNPENKRVNLIYTNSEDKKFADSALTSRDKWHIAGFSAGSIAVGALMSEAIYKGQPDKRKHWMVGATISGLTTGATYMVLETAGVGDKLGLSKNTKKALVMLSGPIMGTIVGILKEVYDSKHKKSHTSDINDAAATSLGAGAAIFAVTFAF